MRIILKLLAAPYVGRLHTVKPNRMELEILAGQEIKDELSLYNACEKTG